MLLCRSCAEAKLTEPNLAFLLNSREATCNLCFTPQVLCANVPPAVERWWKPEHFAPTKLKPVAEPVVFANNMTVTIHAQERMTERWGLTDEEIERVLTLGRAGALTADLDKQRWAAMDGLSEKEIKRFQLCIGLTDEEIARFIQGEVNDALVRNRRSRICPLELVNSYLNNWGAEKDVWFLWTETKDRGYVVLDRPDGVTVLTTLVGSSNAKSMRKLQRPRVG